MILDLLLSSTFLGAGAYMKVGWRKNWEIVEDFESFVTVFVSMVQVIQIL